jgi:hypothetical protein
MKNPDVYKFHAGILNVIKSESAGTENNKPLPSV